MTKLLFRRKFGAKFGRKPINKVVEIMKFKRKKYDCPLCSYSKTLAMKGTGVFNCKKCNYTLASSCYELD